MSNKINLKGLFNGLQNQMNAQLSTSREFIEHSGSKGDALENAWIDWLRKYLPNRYSVDKAIVIDSKGNTSHQIDVVIYDNWFTPFIFSQNGFHYIPAEGVYAVFEVKPDIADFSDGINNVEYAGDKIESVRKLEREATTFINGGRQFGPNPLTKIIGGILCNTNSHTHENNDTLISKIKSISNLKALDLGCIADYASFYVDYTESEISEKGNKPYFDFYEKRTYNNIVFSKKENSLVTFFMQLTRYLQQAIGTIPAINLQKYMDTIDENLDCQI